MAPIPMEINEGERNITMSHTLPYQRQFDATMTTTTEASIQCVRYLASPIEHTLTFHRRSGENVNLALQHFESHNQLDLVVLSNDPDEPVIRQEIELSFQEARLLRDLLNRPEVQAILEREG